jgi:small neutral amino acid transporter SnatA (MarC family)
MSAGSYTIIGGLILFLIGIVAVFLTARLAKNRISPARKK